MVGHGPFFFNKKIKNRRPEHLLTFYPLRPIRSHFYLQLTPTPQSGITPYMPEIIFSNKKLPTALKQGSTYKITLCKWLVQIFLHDLI